MLEPVELRVRKSRESLTGSEISLDTMQRAPLLGSHDPAATSASALRNFNLT